MASPQLIYNFRKYPNKVAIKIIERTFVNYWARAGHAYFYVRYMHGMHQGVMFLFSAYSCDSLPRLVGTELVKNRKNAPRPIICSNLAQLSRRLVRLVILKENSILFY